MKTAVIIPVRNEEESIGKVLDDIPEDKVDLIIVCDNGSTDNSASIGREHGAQVIDVPVIGYGFACRAAADILPADIDTVVFLDGDYSDHPEEMPLLLGPIEKGEADLVIGSRMAGLREKGALPFHSRFGNRLASLLMNLLYGTKITDIGPFRAIRREVLDDLDVQPSGYRWTTEMIAKAAKKGYRVVEIPVRYRPRIGCSKVTGTIKGSLLAGYHILGAIFANMRYK